MVHHQGPSSLGTTHLVVWCYLDFPLNYKERTVSLWHGLFALALTFWVYFVEDISIWIYVRIYIYNIIMCIISTDIYSHYAPWYTTQLQWMHNTCMVYLTCSRLYSSVSHIWNQVDSHMWEREGSELSLSKRDPYLKTPPFSGATPVLVDVLIAGRRRMAEGRSYCNGHTLKAWNVTFWSSCNE